MNKRALCGFVMRIFISHREETFSTQLELSNLFAFFLRFEWHNKLNIKKEQFDFLLF